MRCGSRLHVKEGDQPGADQAIGKALALNPRSAFAQRVKTGEIKFNLGQKLRTAPAL